MGEMTEDERMVKVHDVIQQLPPPHYRYPPPTLSPPIACRSGTAAGVRLLLMYPASPASGRHIWVRFRKTLVTLSPGLNWVLIEGILGPVCVCVCETGPQAGLQRACGCF